MLNGHLFRSRALTWLHFGDLHISTEDEPSYRDFRTLIAQVNAHAAALFRHHHVAAIDMGHTHYRELANDGRTVFAATRSTGQIEEGPVGFSVAAIDRGVVRWRFRPLASPWPLTLITALAVGIGAGLRNVVAGYVVQWFGYSVGFLALAGIALCALALLAVLMPETRTPDPVAGSGAFRPVSPAVA